MAEIIKVSDLPTKVQQADMIDAMVAGANARAARVAPCLVSDEPSEALLAEARLVLLGAVKRWAEAGSGAFTQQTAGSFSISTDTRQRAGFNLWPSEIEALQDVCRKVGDGAEAYMVDMTGLATPTNPLSGAVINAPYGQEPMGRWADGEG